MTKKATTTIVLDPDVREKARRLGISVSKVTENALKLLLERLEDIELPKEVKRASDKKPAEEIYFDEEGDLNG